MVSQITHAQSKYFIFFTDKDGVSFNAFEYFDNKAIERRIREHLSLSDSSDFPVREEYVSAISLNCDSVKIISRWLNGMSVYATENQIKLISSFSFVKNIQLLENAKLISQFSEEKNIYSLDLSKLNLLKFQTFRHQASEFTSHGLNGKGIRIAIFDVGFPGVPEHPAFAAIRNENRIIAAYDFIGNDNNPYQGMSHGTACFSCIAGYYDTIPMGMATDAEFLIAKTERGVTEFESEEDAWLAAAEWADKNGADIISSSLAYTSQRYSPADMDGQKSIVAKAAQMASDKGILVVNAAGNEAEGRWEYLATPADVETVLTVGGINPYTDAHISFSSFGPNAAGVIKPNVCSVGEAITANKNGYAKNFGTSFATPLVAGFAACAWQSNPKLTRAELFDMLQKSSHLFPYFDYAHGYGVPQAVYFTHPQSKEIEPTFTMDSLEANNYEVHFHFSDKFYPEGDLVEHKHYNFYYKFSDVDGNIVYYSVVVPDGKDLEISMPFQVYNNSAAYHFTAHFEGYTFQTELK